MEVEKESYNYILLRVNTKSQSLPEGYPLPVPSRHFPMLIPFSFLVFLLIKKIIQNKMCWSRDCLVDVNLSCSQTEW